MDIGGTTEFVTQDPACSFNVAPTSQSLTATGGTGSVTVGSGVGCSWTATSNASWITITFGSSGTQNGTVNYTVAPNGTTTTRTGTLTIAGKPVTVTETGIVAPTAPTNVRIKG
jgi:hypothetical protein